MKIEDILFNRAIVSISTNEVLNLKNGNEVIQGEKTLSSNSVKYFFKNTSSIMNFIRQQKKGNNSFDLVVACGYVWSKKLIIKFFEAGVGKILFSVQNPKLSFWEGYGNVILTNAEFCEILKVDCNFFVDTFEANEKLYVYAEKS